MRGGLTGCCRAEAALAFKGRTGGAGKEGDHSAAATTCPPYTRTPPARPCPFGVCGTVLPGKGLGRKELAAVPKLPASTPLARPWPADL